LEQFFILCFWSHVDMAVVEFSFHLSILIVASYFFITIFSMALQLHMQLFIQTVFKITSF
jgi:hypothetical protein